MHVTVDDVNFCDDLECAYVKYKSSETSACVSRDKKHGFLPVKDFFADSRHNNLSNNSGTTHYGSLQGSYWADQEDSHNEVIMTSLQKVVL